MDICLADVMTDFTEACLILCLSYIIRFIQDKILLANINIYFCFDGIL